MRIIAVLLSALMLQGCIEALVIGAAGSGVLMAKDPRTVGIQVEDENIELKASRLLSADDAIYEQAHINVISYNTTVLMVGQAPTAEMKSKAAQVIQTIPNVKRIYNEVRVAAPSTMLARSSDTYLTGKIKSKMLIEKDFPSSNIKVVSENGEVFLMGMVSRENARRAVEIARNVDGVQRVIQVFEYTN